MGGDLTALSFGWLACVHISFDAASLTVQVGAASAMRHPHLLAAARDSATVTLVVFSVTDLSSFKALPAMLDELKGDTIFLVATKMDLVASCSVSLVGTLLACCRPIRVWLHIELA